MKLTLQDLKGEQKLYSSVLVYGPPKTGKTRSCSTAKRPIWYWDLNRGVEPLVRVAKTEGWKEDDLVVYRYLPPGGDKVALTVNRPRGRDVYLEVMKDFNVLYDHMDLKTNKWKENLPFRPPATIVFDGIEDFQEIVLDFVLNVAGHELGDKKTDARDDYGNAMDKVEECIVSTQGLPCDSIWITHESVMQDETTGQIRSDPYIVGKKLPQRIGRHFGAVLYSSFKAPDKYVWYVKPQGYVKVAGSRGREFKEGEVNQNFKDVL